MFDTPKPTKERIKKYPFKLLGDFLNKIATDETNINTEIFNEYFKYQNLSSLVKNLYKANENRIEKIVNHGNDASIDLRNDVIKKILKMKTLIK